MCSRLSKQMVQDGHELGTSATLSTSGRGRKGRPVTLVGETQSMMSPEMRQDNTS